MVLLFSCEENNSESPNYFFGAYFVGSSDFFLSAK